MNLSTCTTLDTFLIRKATSADRDLVAIKRLADANRDTIGFVRRPALIEAIAKGWILLAQVEDSIVGFVNFRHRQDAQTTLYEICVAETFRRQGIGRALIHTLQVESRILGKERIVLKAPSDIPANDFYQHIGFTFQATQPGKKRTLNIWMLEGK